jgi:RNA polymerase sigma-70 factor (ECF subfamily)
MGAVTADATGVARTTDEHALERGRRRTERALVERAQRGDREAHASLYVLHYSEILSFLRSRVGNRYDAEDLTTQTFMRMLEAIDRYEPRAVPFSAWLRQIARNLAIDHFRETRRLEPRGEVPEGPPSRSAEDEALERASTQALARTVRTLSPQQRKVVALKFFAACSNAEAAAALNHSEGAVKALQHRALDTLSRRLAPALAA